MASISGGLDRLIKKEKMTAADKAVVIGRIRSAAELGATIALTDNDETNAPMLAVNRRLGYRPFARRLEWERAAATSSP